MGSINNRRIVVYGVYGKITIYDLYIYTRIKGESFRDWYDANIKDMPDVYVDELAAMLRNELVVEHWERRSLIYSYS